MTDDHVTREHATGADVPEQASWDARYARATVWSGAVNPQLEAEAAALPPGRVLDVGCGEGADALWLADRGWAVTALDLSGVALERAARHASDAGRGDGVVWRQGDVRSLVTDERWDLVSAQYFHAGDVVDVVRRLAGWVAPGGTLLVVGHHPADLAVGLRQRIADVLFTAEQVATAVDDDGWTVEVRAARERPARVGDADVTVTDAVLRARRHG